ncbi:MAG: hypothetical protein FJ246_05820, partial [Nitrospira sp.]|nr:hypothetical protein [Nitrospira sp.]
MSTRRRQEPVGRTQARTFMGTALALVLAALAGCAQPPHPAPKDLSEPPPPTTTGIASVEYWRDIKPILDRRCAVCHGCYDAPCQLNLSAYE